MLHDEFFSIDTSAQPWDERFNPKLGKVIFARICTPTRRPGRKSGSFATLRGW